MASAAVMNSQELRTEPFRNYDNSVFQDRVSLFYYNNNINQTVDFVMEQKRKLFNNSEKFQMTMWDACELMNTLVDQSDTDTEYPQIMHCFQTAEAIRKDFPGEEYDWFALTGFLHDCGKVLAYPKLYNLPQWAVVGDTYPVGCAYSDKIVFNQFLKENPDYNNSKYNTKFGIYHEGIGLNNVHFSFGHDEYLYQVCVRNNCSLPPSALYIIRYHSFYPWHQHNAYDYLTNDVDKEMLQWVKLFQKYDLYSKLPEKPNVETLTPYYKKLINKYFPTMLEW